MQKSTVISEWIQQGEQAGEAKGAAVLRAKLLHYLRKRFAAEVPAPLKALIEAQTELPVLDHWFDLALEATSIEQLGTSLTSVRAEPGNERRVDP